MNPLVRRDVVDQRSLVRDCLDGISTCVGLKQEWMRIMIISCLK